ncbi:uncharacterized protein containing dhhc-type zn finger [Stylonychia lemnae]|uniref:Palmitoyltransferase n=1 Tax=Stylonychia lemnae TaxID=5949 RepID=A0A077ZSA7_STYLE|nr:uncharacterized protein containing dhhc-type zn finger [Stylonychia lemnae]|eukprot:CDW71331.1 uncharacterized protein containing dhhc-type zn finger [Stylonychia lemnae]
MNQQASFDNQSSAQQNQGKTEQNFYSSQATNALLDGTPDLIKEEFQSNQKGDKNKQNDESPQHTQLSEEESPDKIKLNNRFPRRNGTECPWAIPQIFGLLIITLNLIQNIVIDLPCLDYQLGFGGIILFSVLLFLNLMIFVFAVICARKDPTDPIIYEQRKIKFQGLAFDDANYEYFCERCDAHVMELTKHCNRCNRCTKHFDHHCIWLNNCVGYNNYRDFCLLIGFMLANSVSSVIYNINVIHVHTLYGFEVFIIILNAVISLAIGYLSAYHLWLKFNGLTTYAHIMMMRDRARRARSSYEESENEIDEGQTRLSVINDKPLNNQAGQGTNQSLKGNSDKAQANSSEQHKESTHYSKINESNLDIKPDENSINGNNQQPIGTAPTVDNKTSQEFSLRQADPISYQQLRQESSRILNRNTPNQSPRQNQNRSQMSQQRSSSEKFNYKEIPVTKKQGGYLLSQKSNNNRGDTSMEHKMYLKSLKGASRNDSQKQSFISKFKNKLQNALGDSNAQSPRLKTNQELLYPRLGSNIYESSSNHQFKQKAVLSNSEIQSPKDKQHISLSYKNRKQFRGFQQSQDEYQNAKEDLLSSNNNIKK